MDDVTIGRGITIPAGEIEFLASRASGPGGQGVNTTSSKVELRFDVAATAALDADQKRLVFERLGNRITDDGVLVIRSSEHRSQHRNREAAVARLRALLGEAVVPDKPRRRTRPTRAARERRLEEKRRRAEVKRQRRPPGEP